MSQYTVPSPDIAGTKKANPIATILSASMMLRYSFNLIEEADAIDNAVEKALDLGYTTSDIGGKLNTDEVTEKIIEMI